MKTLDLLEAAAFLRLHPETLRRMAVAGEVPSARPGKCWVFLDVDLADWLRGLYDKAARAAEGETPCSTADQDPVFGGCASPPQTAKRYAAALAPRTRKALKNTKRG